MQSLTTSERKVVLQHGADGRYVASGHLVYMQRGVLMAVPFDLRRLQANGGAIGVVADVMQAANMLNEAWDSGAGQFSVSDTGSLLYAPGGIFPDPELFLVWVERAAPSSRCRRLPARICRLGSHPMDGKSWCGRAAIATSGSTTSHDAL